MLRCFGQLINELECRYNAGTYILSYINEYCSGYLCKLRLVRIPEKHLNLFMKPFCKFEEVSIHNCHFNDEKCWLKDTFPHEVESWKRFNLDSTYFRLLENEYFAHHFSHLENLEIKMYFVVADDSSQGNENFKTTYRLKQQLKTFVLSLIEHIQNLEALDITGNLSFYDSFNRNTLHLRNLKQFRFNLCYEPAKDHNSDSFQWKNRIRSYLFE